MDVGQRVRRGILFGAGAAAVYFSANLAGMFAAIGWLFDPTWSATVLLLVPFAATLLIGASLGAMVAIIWPTRLRVRRRLLRIALIVLAVVVMAISYGSRVGRNLPPAGTPPAVSATMPAPVLWVVIDTLRADQLYGADRSFPHAPRLGAWARRSLIFADAESSAGWTIPATATLLTGIHNTTVDASAGFLPDWAPTLAERLTATGFDTHAVVDNTILEPRNGFAAGFATFAQRSGFRFAFSLPTFRMLPKALREYLRHQTRASYDGAPDVTDMAIAELERPRDRPLFLYVHYMDPHAPYYFHPQLGPDPPEGEPMAFWRVRDRLREDEGPLPTSGQLALLHHRYAGEIQYVDASLARLLDAWQARYADTGMVLITADHGEEFVEHGHLSHSLTVHREVIHVPLLLRLPAGALPAERATGWVEPAVSHIDLVPTTLELLGIDPGQVDEGPALQGTSWLSWLRGESEAPHRPMVASHSRFGRRIYRYREANLVFIKEMFYDGRPTQLHLYDLQKDPAEQDNLIGERQARAPAIETRCDRLASVLREAYDPAAPSDSRADETSLRALGYIQ